MIKFIPFFCFLLLCNFAFGQSGYIINGTINDYKGTIELEYDDIVKSTQVKDGKFSFSGAVILPTEAVIRVPSRMKRSFAKFLIENDTLDLSVDAVPRELLGNSFLELRAFVKKGGIQNQLLISFHEQSRVALDIASVTHVYMGILGKKIAEFCEAKPKDIAPLHLVVQYLPEISRSNLEKIYAGIDEGFRNHKYAKIIDEKLAENLTGSIGERFLDFSEFFMGGNEFDSRSLRGRYALIEFWADDCVPCREEHISLRKVYSKYLPKGFEIVSILKYSDYYAKLYVKDTTTKLEWSTISMRFPAENAEFKTYVKKSFPNNYLLDPDGKIIATNLNARELGLKLAELLP